MTDLIKQAEALDKSARYAAEQAAIQERSAAEWRVHEADARDEAAKLREQAREPLRLWVNWHEAGDHYSYDTEADAREGAGPSARRIAVPMVEVRPVRITPEHEQQAWQIFNDTYGFGAKPWRAVMEYALSLAGVEVEK